MDRADSGHFVLSSLLSKSGKAIKKQFDLIFEKGTGAIGHRLSQMAALPDVDDRLYVFRR
ncbi:MAG: hypothetical protein R3C26_08375 [Calditrichia bacterium]